VAGLFGKRNQALGLPIHFLPMADSEHQYDKEFLLDLVNDPEFPAAPAVQSLKLAAQCLTQVGIFGQMVFDETQQPFLIRLGNCLKVFKGTSFDEGFIGQALSWPVRE